MLRNTVFVADLHQFRNCKRAFMLKPKGCVWWPYHVILQFDHFVVNMRLFEIQFRHGGLSGVFELVFALLDGGGLQAGPDRPCGNGVAGAVFINEEEAIVEDGRPKERTWRRTKELVPRGYSSRNALSQNGLSQNGYGYIYIYTYIYIEREREKM